MNKPPELIAQVRQWMEKAENDFRNAEYVLTMKDHCPYDTVAYHCQQCIEKYLKAFLIYRSIDFPKTHDLVILFNRLKGDGSLPFSVEDLQPLNRYCVEARYPGEWEPIEEMEARAAFDKTRIIREAILSILEDGVS